MTVNEFKAWFEGFSEGIYGPPTAKQWERIQEKIKELGQQNSPAPYRIYPSL